MTGEREPKFNKVPDDGNGRRLLVAAGSSCSTPISPGVPGYRFDFGKGDFEPIAKGGDKEVSNRVPC